MKQGRDGNVVGDDSSAGNGCGAKEGQGMAVVVWDDEARLGPGRCTIITRGVG